MGLLLSCANPKPPSGGPPDRTPPKVVEYSPQNYTINYKDKELIIKFNKWVDRGSVVNNIFINPPIKYEAKWSGKKLKVAFAESLPEGTTFSFLLGTNYSDLDGNKPNEPFSLVFSTGNKIDSGKIFGKVITNIKENIYIFAIPSESLKDTSFDVNSSFHYLTQPDNNGNFKFEALRPNYYFLFAFGDKNNNKAYDNGFESFGISSDSIYASDNDSPDTNFIMLSPPADETPPIPLDANYINKNSVKLTFSEPIVLKENFNPNSIKVIDTLSKSIVSPFLAQIDYNNPKNLLLFLTDTLSETIYEISIVDPQSISDTSGNSLITGKNLLFKVSKANEKSIPNLFKQQIFLSSLSDEVKVTFTIPLDTIRTKFSIYCTNLEQKDTVQINYTFIKPNQIFLTIPKLKWRNSYTLILKADSIFNFTGYVFKNTQYKVELKTGDEPRLGTLRGWLLAKLDTSYGKPSILAIGDNNKAFYTEVVNNQWTFENIPEGEYFLVAFYDTNLNKVLEAGRLKPFRFSEKIIKVSGKISVKKGWSIEEIRF
jgi:hypothetical protein